MYKRIFCVIIVVLCTLPARSFALRCGSDLIDVGDLKIEVKLACGEPLSKEIIGYVDKFRYKSYPEGVNREGKNGREERIRVMSIEEWIIKESGNYYSLVFEGNKLKEIEWANR